MLVCKKRMYAVLFLLSVGSWLLSPCNVFSEEKNSEESTEDLIETSKKILNQLIKPVDLNTRDPFSLARRISIGSESLGDYEFYPSENASILPTLKLRGFIEDKANVIALLDIEDHGVFLVRKGDTVGLQSSMGHTVLKVKDITKLSILVEVGTVGQVVIVR